MLANLLNGHLRNCAKDARDTITVRALPRSLAWFQISCENTNPTSEELEQNKRMLISLGNGVRLRNCAKGARDTAIVGFCRNTESRHGASRMRAPHGRHGTRHAHGSCNEGITRMMVVSVSGNRNLHLVSALPDERSEPDERRFGDRDSNSRSSSSRREVASYLAGELSSEMQTPHQKKTLQQETTTDPMQIWWESYQLIDAQLSLHQSPTCGSSSGILFFIPTTTTVGNPQFLIGNIRRQLLLQLLHLNVITPARLPGMRWAPRKCLSAMGT